MSAFRFLTSGKRGHYSVQRGDVHIGYVTKRSHRIYGKEVIAGWDPETLDRRALPREDTRELAARALWDRRPIS
jgi:hypothetical protein